MNISDKIAQAKQRQDEVGPPWRKVTVSLDAEVTEKLRDVEERIEQATKQPQDARLSKKSPLALLLKEAEAVQAEYVDTLIDLKFYRILGSDWNDLTIVNPPREDSVPDLNVFGYNIHAVTRAAAIRSGVVIEDGDERRLTEDQWNDLFLLLSGQDHENIANTVYAVNQGDTDRAVELGKALRAATSTSETKSD